MVQGAIFCSLVTHGWLNSIYVLWICLINLFVQAGDIIDPHKPKKAMFCWAIFSQWCNLQ